MMTEIWLLDFPDEDSLWKRFPKISHKALFSFLKVLSFE